MNLDLVILLVLTTALVPGPDDRLGLADLAAYRAALSGRAISENDGAARSAPPARVGFRELWEGPERYRGGRVVVRGEAQRAFQQGPVGEFPALVQLWIFSPAGDPFCLVFPRPEGKARFTFRPGEFVEFIGTFLKMARYAGGDGDRLAPLIVGDRPPAPIRAHAQARPDANVDRNSQGAEIWRAIGGGGPAARARGWLPIEWGLALVLATVAAGAFVWRSRSKTPAAPRSAQRRGTSEPPSADPPLSFFDAPDGPTRVQ